MVSFFCPGIPRPKGSTRSFRHAKTGAIITRADNAEKLEPWEGRIAAFGRAAGLRCTASPVRVDLAFYLPRPKSHLGKRGVRPSAPSRPAKKPDLDKLARAVLDALTRIAWEDDQQVVVLGVRKEWADGDGVEAGVGVTVEEVE